MRDGAQVLEDSVHTLVLEILKDPFDQPVGSGSHTPYRTS
jgi:hypothetical protein